jgi:hypothetical protein
MDFKFKKFKKCIFDIYQVYSVYLSIIALDFYINKILII